MELQRLIDERVLNHESELYGLDGLRISSEVIKSQYLKLRNYFSNLDDNELLAISLPKNHQFMICILAAMSSGVTYVPINPKWPAKRINQIQEETDFTLFIDEDKIAHILNQEIGEFHSKPLDETDTLYIICTSGSTGRPKAVKIGRPSFINFLSWLDDYFPQISNKDRVLQITDFTFDISLVDVGLYLQKRTPVYFSNFQGNIFSLAHEIEKYKITTINTVVNNANMLLEEAVKSRANYQSVENLLLSAARFSYGLYKKCLDNFSQKNVYNLYGPTEGTIFSTAKKLSFNESDLENFNVSVGNYLSGTGGLIYKDGKEVPAYESGELVISGKQLLQEYKNNPEKTEEVIFKYNNSRYYKTGDIAFKNDNHDIFITGRTDDTIKYRGYRIDLLDINSYILTLSYVEDCIVIAIEDELTQNKTIAFLKTSGPKKSKEVKKDLENVLLEYQIPQKIHFVDEYPINNSGKVCKKTLKENYLKKIKFYK